jgi:hypothetical protein
MFILPQNLCSLPKAVEKEALSPISYSVDGEVVVVLFGGEARVEVGGDEGDTVVFLGKARNDVFKNIFDSSSVRGVVIEQKKEFFHCRNRVKATCIIVFWKEDARKGMYFII